LASGQALDLGWVGARSAGILRRPAVAHARLAVARHDSRGGWANRMTRGARKTNRAPGRKGRARGRGCACCGRASGYFFSERMNAITLAMSVSLSTTGAIIALPP